MGNLIINFKMKKESYEEILVGDKVYEIIKKYTDIEQPIFYVFSTDPINYKPSILFVCGDCFRIIKRSDTIMINFIPPKEYDINLFGIPFKLNIPEGENIQFLVNGKSYIK